MDSRNRSESDHSRKKVLEDLGWQFEDAAASHGTCELCLSETITSLQYGMWVCPACDRTYLP